MADKYMERCSTSLVIKEMQTKATVRYPFIPTRMAAIKKTGKNKRWRGGGETGALALLAGTQKGAGALGPFGHSSKVRHRVTIGPNNSTSRLILKRNEAICPHKNVHMNVHTSISYNSRHSPSVH